MTGAEDFTAARYRAVFISDIHLGAPGCQAELLLDFLRHMSCERLYLVGDIVDGWRMKRGWFWPQSHNDVVQKLLRHARKGAEVVYVPGNHDDRVRDFCGVHFGGVKVMREAVHTTLDGRRFLVVHGDRFDGLVGAGALRALIGDLAYKALAGLNTRLNRLRRRLGLGYWSLSGHVKSQVASARRFVERFETAAARAAAEAGFDGVICGHVHQAALRRIDGVVYANDGDWVDSCTSLVEHPDGRLEILDWAARRSWSMIAKDPRLEEAAWTVPEPAALERDLA